MASCCRIMRRIRSPNAHKTAIFLKSHRLIHCTTAFRVSSSLRNGRIKRHSIGTSTRLFSGIHPDFQTSFKTDDASDIKKQIESDVKENDTFLFMKGTPAMPQCGFSKNCITILNYLEVDFKTRDVLSHPSLRSAIKEYSDWPTFPQLYHKGELIGGHDIVVDMFKSGELHEALGVEDPEPAAEDKFGDK